MNEKPATLLSLALVCAAIGASIASWLMLAIFFPNPPMNTIIILWATAMLLLAGVLYLESKKTIQ